MPNGSGFQNRVGIYLCPSDPSPSSAAPLVPAALGSPYNGIRNCNYSNYAANFLVFGLYNGLNGDPRRGLVAGNVNGANRYLDYVRDGTSRTVFFTERYQWCEGPNRTVGGCIWAAFVPPNFSPFFAVLWRGGTQGGLTFNPNAAPPQGRPAPGTCDPQKLQSGHMGGINVCMGDASVRGVLPSLSADTWNKACLPMDGNPLPADWNQ